MAGKRKETAPLLHRAARVDVGDDAPLGPLQARIVGNVLALGELESFGYRLLEEVMAETGKWIDPPAVYSNIYKLLKPERGVLERAEAQYIRRGPPLKPFRVTAKGVEALQETIAYHKKLVADLERKVKAAELRRGGEERRSGVEERRKRVNEHVTSPKGGPRRHREG